MEARRKLNDAKRKDQDKVESVYDFLIGQSYYRENNYEKAIFHFQHAVEIEPDLAAGYNNMGSAYFAWALDVDDPEERRSLLQQSVTNIKQAIEFSPSEGSPTLYVNLALIYSEMEDFVSAFDAINSYSGAPSGIISYVTATTHALVGELAMAMEHLAKALALDPNLGLNAALDDDFAKLREDAGFVEMLTQNLGPDLMKAAQQTWINE